MFSIAIVVAGSMASVAAYAAPTDVPSVVRVGFSKSQTVKCTLRNDSSAQLQLKLGEEIVSIDAGKTLAVKIPVGTKIVVNVATAGHAAGEVIAEISKSLDNATLAIK